MEFPPLPVAELPGRGGCHDTDRPAFDARLRVDSRVEDARNLFW